MFIEFFDIQENKMVTAWNNATHIPLKNDVIVEDNKMFIVVSRIWSSQDFVTVNVEKLP